LEWITVTGECVLDASHQAACWVGGAWL